MDIGILDLCKGRTIIVSTEVGVDVELVVKEIKENHHSRDVGEANAANDWWPAQETWIDFTVTFTNGHSKNFTSLKSIKFKP